SKGGKTWDRILHISEHTGVNDLIMDNQNPDVLFAAAFQRRRHVFTYLGGGPESGLHVSRDGGTTWQPVSNELTKADMGRIGLAQSPANPDVIYATVEAALGKSGCYVSEDRGASWQKRSDFVTSGNYYQEIVADPADPQTLYALDTWLHVSKDGGRSFSMVGEVTKHVDNHSMWIDPDNTSHWIVGCDGGIYQTWDAAATWAFSSNLPVTQFYKVAVDNAEPFYNIYGGTQDNFSIGGPSRTTTAHGIVNSDWFITHGGDGFETQIDPTNPDIVYAQSQYGFLVRFDKASGEEVGIQPQPGPGEAAYRWNWDAPLQISSHSPTRLYFAANKLFRSDDRGDSWTTISPDLTQQIDRNTLPVMDRIWGLDAVNKNRSTSPYGTIVAFSESPLDPNLLYVGTDDGLIQKTTDGGTTWSAIDAFPGLPERSYVNMVLASAHDANVVYACFNHHKYGDFTPYVYKSTDCGTTRTSLSANLPERGSSYAIAEDHIDPKLLFVGTEFGAFFSNDSGSHWHRLKAGLPTVAVRDIAIQQREDDLVLGTFGRGFYVLDDYSPLRSLTAEFLTQEGALFPVRTALAYEASMPLGLPGKSFQGDNFYSGENLGPDALLTYYLKESIQSLKDERREREKQVENVKWPTEEALRAEEEELEPLVVLTISDANGEVVRKMEVPASKGLHRVKWDLRYASTNPIRLSKPSFYNPWGAKDIGTLVMPGMYNASLAVVRNGVANQLGQPVTFQVSALKNTTLPAPNRAEKVAFQREVSDWARQV
ncbi:MAG: glycosyl hydrolase, partial [Saprospiraceae bacterium]